MTNKELQNLLKTYPEEIKVGEKYRIELLCILNQEKVIVFETPSGDHIPLRNSDIECVSSADGTKNAEPAPKYDPCRKFREGDIVEPCQVKGRWLSEAWKNRKGIHYKVTSDEDDDSVMWVLDPDSHHQKYVAAVFFQLVTPVEALKPYSVHESDTINGFDIMREGLCVMTFPYGSKEAGYYRNKLAAKEAAEAERDRLNAEFGRRINETTKTQTTESK